jgi:hypothetical protein
MLEQGIIPGIRLGRRWIITRHAYEQWERTSGMRARTGLHAQPGNGVELMSVYKRKYLSGTVLRYFRFQPPGEACGTLPIRQFGFATKQKAIDAEANRRIDEQQKNELAKAGAGVAEALPKDAVAVDAEVSSAARWGEISAQDRRAFGYMRGVIVKDQADRAAGG